MSDLISRQAAIKTAHLPVIDDAGYEVVRVDDIMALPSAQPGWIPCGERLPKPNEYENDVRKYYLVQNEHGDMMVCSWHGGFWMQMYRNTHVEDKVVAWMPLPTPYREGGQDNGLD